MVLEGIGENALIIHGSAEEATAIDIASDFIELFFQRSKCSVYIPGKDVRSVSH